MNPPAIPRLNAALQGRYHIERELGEGGMATVYLADDLKHERKVALKVLKPELAAVVGAERFLAEIKTTANLQHPHILPLYDSGEADSLLFYVMPYVEGESLRERLDREHQLPIDEAIRIATDVAEALQVAHEQGVIHRDIKPANILLSRGRPLVADFGIALAVSSAGGDRLTQTGASIGTPHYMSPEQAAGESHIDARSDLYSLAAMLYETLADEPPYTGRTARVVMMKRLTDAVPSVRRIRDSVPVGVDAVIQKALAPVPADRYPTVVAFATALKAAGSREVPGGLVSSRKGRRGMTWAVAASVAVALVVVAVLSLPWSPPAPEIPLNPDLVAVVPFRVSAGDASVQYLGEGMVDLLAAKLTGDGGPLAVNPGRVLRARSQVDDAVENTGEDIDLLTAASVGAGLLLSGGVVQEQNRLVISASLLEVPDGDVRGQTSVSGPPDSLPALIDRLTAELLSLSAGEDMPRLAGLTTTSLPALRAYLEGRVAERGGRYVEAAEHQRRALDLDSTFALAGLAMALGWSGSTSGERAAWQHRDRLSRRDQVLLTALVGEDPAAVRSYSEQLAGWEVAVSMVPDQPYPWEELGEHLLHYGRLLGLEAPLERAAAAFRRALALDSALATPLVHGMEIATLAGDTAEVRRLAKRFLAIRPPPAASGYVRWHMAHVLRDSTALSQERSGLDTLSDRSLLEIFQIGQWFGFGMEDVVPAAEEMLNRASTLSRRRLMLDRTATLAHNRGRPAEALRARQAARQLDPASGTSLYLWRVAMDAMYWNGDTAIAAQAVEERATHADAPLPVASGPRTERFYDLCTVEQWRLWHGQTASAPESIRKLRSYAEPTDPPGLVHEARYCATLLEAMTAVAEDRSDAPAAVARLDSLWRSGPVLGEMHGKSAPLVISRLYQAIGDVPGALAAIRSRLVYGPNRAEYFSSYVRQEGRLAVLVGDREGAVRAYLHYLGLRDAPQASVQREVDEVRAELGRLMGEGAPERPLS